MRGHPRSTQWPPSTNLLAFLPTTFISISLPLSFHPHHRPRTQRTRFDAPHDILIPLSHPFPLDCSSLSFTNRTPHLPLLIFDTPYTILAHPAYWYPNPEPNLESGANIDCCKLYRDNKPVSITSTPLAFHPWPVFRGSSVF